MKKIVSIFVGVLLLSAGAVYLFATYQKINAVPRLLQHMFSEDINDRFMSSAARVVGKQNLHVARLDRVEIYERTSKAQILGVSLPDVIVSATFPVEYNFQISLTAPWKFEKKDQVLWVYPPELSAQTPAVNVSEMKFEIRKGSILRNETEVKERLQKDLTAYLSESSILLREKVRSEARKSIEMFVRTWVASQFADTTASAIPIKIIFPGESGDDIAPASGATP